MSIKNFKTCFYWWNKQSLESILQIIIITLHIRLQSAVNLNLVWWLTDCLILCWTHPVTPHVFRVPCSVYTTYSGSVLR